MVRWDARSADGPLTLTRIVDVRLPRAPTADSCMGSLANATDSVRFTFIRLGPNLRASGQMMREAQPEPNTIDLLKRFEESRLLQRP